MWYDTQLKTEPSEDRLVCRDRRTRYTRFIWAAWVASILLPVLVLPLAPRGTSPAGGVVQGIFATFCAFSIVFALLCPLMAVVLLRRKIEAAPEGIRWCGVFQSRAAAWEDVTDYYDIIPASTDTSRNGDQSVCIETRHGRIRFNKDNWCGETELRDYIATHATRARAKAWDVRRQRPEDYPVAKFAKTNSLMWHETRPEPRSVTEEGVACRPTTALSVRAIWILWAVSVPLYWLILSAVRECKDPALVSNVQGIVFLLGSVLIPFAVFWPPAAIYAQRARVIASPDGLSWRGAFRSHFASWQDVTDYYDTFRVSTDSKHTVYRWMSVKTRQGRMRLLRGDHCWTHEAELRDYITTHATQAKARSWGILRRRPEDFPVVCHYDTRIHRHAPRFLREWHGITLAAVAVYFAWCWETTHTLPGWGWLLTPTGVFVAAKEIALLALHSTYAETRRRLGQTITLADDGVAFEDGTRRITAHWDEITDFYTAGLGSVRYVETENGTFDFLSTLQEGELLQQIILNRTTRAGQIFWRSKIIAPKRKQFRTA